MTFLESLKNILIALALTLWAIVVGFLIWALKRAKLENLELKRKGLKDEIQAIKERNRSSDILELIARNNRRGKGEETNEGD